MNKTRQIWRNIDLFSLRLRLTIGIATVSAIGNGSIAIWTSWRMQQILIDSHKNHIEQIAARLPQDVGLYSEMMLPETGLQKAINNLTNTKTFLWVKNPARKVVAQSPNWNSLSNSTVAELMSKSEMPIKPEVYKAGQHYFVLYGGSLQVQGKVLGMLFVVQDITRDQTMFLAMVRTLWIASILVIIVITFALAYYIKRSLHPLRQLSQMTEVISAKDLAQVQLHLDNPPSEVKELAQTFNMLLSRLSQSWEQEQEFVSNVSHELRTPLTIVHGYLQSVLRRQNNLTPTQQEALETASSEAKHTIRLLQDLLDLARADSGYFHFHIQSCVLNDLVAEVVGMAKKYSERTIQIEENTSPLKAKVDYNRLKQVLLNLIDNAVKYSEPNTPIILKLNQQGQQAILQVCDQGYGIPLQHQSRIFERFYRVDEARNHTTGGSGLGLSIVKTLVEGMGGDVKVLSKLGEGSVFTVILPI
ncbi:sensor histidine kinase [Mastigocladopsis repens]|uniref:sensor histidine kinase n=1 Tax=Mastigocladopsis repens TaxID=221287 RepID=UPI0002DD1A5A|nr:HAMP domain-containing sensor histidine kinase [Mastigocladopsis repens]